MKRSAGNRIAAAIIAGLLPESAFADETLQQRVETFAKPCWQVPSVDGGRPEVVEAILVRPDPGTFFLRYAFGLKQHAKKLLTAEQATALNAVLEKHTPAHSRWHDERNTLRCKFNEQMWLHAAAADADAPALRTTLEAWMRLRMLWTQQEHLAQYRFARDVWNVLTADQQQKLITGEWKGYAKQDIGHTRGDATAKIIVRALGKPDDKAAFDTVVAAWSEKRVSLHADVAETENRERRIVFAMDLNSEAMANEACQSATAAYAALYLAEADAIRRIVRAGYANPASRCVQAASAAWNEAAQRFQSGAGELIKVLGSP